jgi:hypothetical protein
MKFDSIRALFDAVRQQRATVKNATSPWANGQFATLQGQNTRVNLNPDLVPRFASYLGEDTPSRCC